MPPKSQKLAKEEAAKRHAAKQVWVQRSHQTAESAKQTQRVTKQVNVVQRTSTSKQTGSKNTVKSMTPMTGDQHSDQVLRHQVKEEKQPCVSIKFTRGYLY